MSASSASIAKEGPTSATEALDEMASTFLKDKKKVLPPLRGDRSSSEDKVARVPSSEDQALKPFSPLPTSPIVKRGNDEEECGTEEEIPFRSKGQADEDRRRTSTANLHSWPKRHENLRPISSNRPLHGLVTLVGTHFHQENELDGPVAEEEANQRKKEKRMEHKKRMKFSPAEGKERPPEWGRKSRHYFANQERENHNTTDSTALCGHHNRRRSNDERENKHKRKDSHNMEEYSLDSTASDTSLLYSSSSSSTASFESDSRSSKKMKGSLPHKHRRVQAMLKNDSCFPTGSEGTCQVGGEDDEEEAPCPTLVCSTASVSRSFSRASSRSSPTNSYSLSGYSGSSSPIESDRNRRLRKNSVEQKKGEKKEDSEEKKRKREHEEGKGDNPYGEERSTSHKIEKEKKSEEKGEGNEESFPYSVNSCSSSTVQPFGSPLGISPSENRLVCRRNAICALVNISILEEELKTIKKSVKERKQLIGFLLQNRLFSFMDDEAIDATVDAMKVEKHSKGDVVMKEGEDCLPQLYVLLHGSCLFCHKGENVKTVGPGAYFGELQLMHPQSSAVMTVECIKDTTFYTLHHHHFQHILLRRCLQQRDCFKRCIDGVAFLQELSEYDRQRLTDALSMKQFDSGELIISYGQRCHELYFLIEGKTRVTGRTEDGSPVEICTQEPVSVIGELEFLFEDSAVADVVVISTYAKLGRVTREHFEAVLGPIPMSLLRFVARAATYEPYIEKFIKTYPNRKISRQLIQMKEHPDWGLERGDTHDEESDFNDSTKSVGGRSEGEGQVEESDVKYAEEQPEVAKKSAFKKFYPAAGIWNTAHQVVGSLSDSFALPSSSSFPGHGMQQSYHVISPPISSPVSPYSHHAELHSLPFFISNLSASEAILLLPPELIYRLPDSKKKQFEYSFSHHQRYASALHHSLSKHSPYRKNFDPAYAGSPVKAHSSGSPIVMEMLSGSPNIVPFVALSSLDHEEGGRGGGNRRRKKKQTKEVLKEKENTDTPFLVFSPSSQSSYSSRRGKPRSARRKLDSEAAESGKGVVHSTSGRSTSKKGTMEGEGDDGNAKELERRQRSTTSEDHGSLPITQRLHLSPRNLVEGMSSKEHCHRAPLQEDSKWRWEQQEEENTGIEDDDDEDEEEEEDVDISAFPPFARFPLPDILQFGTSFLLCVREDGVILSWDSTLSALTGYSGAHALGESLFAFVEKEDEHTLLQKTIEHAVTQQQKIEEEEEHRRRIHGGKGLAGMGKFGYRKGHYASSSVCMTSPTWGSPMLSSTLPSLHLGPSNSRFNAFLHGGQLPSPSTSLMHSHLLYHRTHDWRKRKAGQHSAHEGGEGMGPSEGEPTQDEYSPSITCHLSRLDGITSVRVELMAYALAIQTPLNTHGRGGTSTRDESASRPRHRRDGRRSSHSLGGHGHYSTGRWRMGSLLRRSVAGGGGSEHEKGRDKRERRKSGQPGRRGNRRGTLFEESVLEDNEGSHRRGGGVHGVADSWSVLPHDNKEDGRELSHWRCASPQDSLHSSKTSFHSNRRRPRRRLVYRVVLFLGKEVGLQHRSHLSGGLEPSEMLLEMRRVLSMDTWSYEHRFLLFEEMLENFETIQRAHAVSTEGWQPVHLRELVGKTIMESIRECISKNHVIHQRYENLSSEVACIDVALLPRVLKHTLRIATHEMEECEVTVTVSIRQHANTKFLAFIFSTLVSQSPSILVEWERIMRLRQKREGGGGGGKGSPQRGEVFRSDRESVILPTEERMKGLPSYLPRGNGTVLDGSSTRGGGGGQNKVGGEERMHVGEEEIPRDIMQTGHYPSVDVKEFVCDHAERASPMPRMPFSSSLPDCTTSMTEPTMAMGTGRGTAAAGHEECALFVKSDSSMPEDRVQTLSEQDERKGEERIGALTWDAATPYSLGALQTNVGSIPDTVGELSTDFSHIEPLVMGSPEIAENAGDYYRQPGAVDRNHTDDKGGMERVKRGRRVLSTQDSHFHRDVLFSGNSSSSSRGGADGGRKATQGIPPGRDRSGTTTAVGKGKILEILSIEHPRFRNYLRGIRHAVEQQGGTIRISRDSDKYHLIYLFPFIPAESEEERREGNDEALGMDNFEETKRGGWQDSKAESAPEGIGAVMNASREFPSFLRRHVVAPSDPLHYPGHDRVGGVPEKKEEEGPFHGMLDAGDEKASSSLRFSFSTPEGPFLMADGVTIDAGHEHLLAPSLFSSPNRSDVPPLASTPRSSGKPEVATEETHSQSENVHPDEERQSTPWEERLQKAPTRAPSKVSTNLMGREIGYSTPKETEEKEHKNGKDEEHLLPLGTSEAFMPLTPPLAADVSSTSMAATDSIATLPIRPCTTSLLMQPSAQGSPTPDALIAGPPTTLPYNQEELNRALKSISFTTLVADENAVQRNLVCKFLWQRKHAVLYAVTFMEMEKLSDSADILIVDALQFSFQNNNTIHFLQEKTRELSIVVAGEMDAISCEAYAGTGFLVLPKPIHPNNFRSVITQAEERILSRKKEALSIYFLRQTLSGYRMTAWTRGELLGKGAHGEVYKATSVITGVEMAVKELRVGPNVERLEEILTEITTMCSLQHPNIIHYFSCELSAEAVLVTSTGSDHTPAVPADPDMGLPPPFSSSAVSSSLHVLDGLSPKEGTPTAPRPPSMPPPPALPLSGTSITTSLSTKTKKSRLLLASPRDTSAEPPPVTRFLRVFMEYAAGGSLREYLTKNGPLEFRMFQTLLHQIVSGLAYIHAHHYVHGDMKTPNILLTEQLVGKIGDFGSARRMMSGELCYKMEGSVAYMSPECLSAGEVNESGHRTGFSFPTDIWSLGVVAMEMITNQPPYSHVKGVIGPASLTQYLTTLKSETPDLSPLFQYPPSVTEFIAACLRVNPLKRATAEELLHYSIFHESSDVEAISALKALRQAELRHALSQFVAFQEPLWNASTGKDGHALMEEKAVRMSNGGAAILADDSDDFFDSDTTEDSAEEEEEEEEEEEDHKEPQTTYETEMEPIKRKDGGEPPSMSPRRVPVSLSPFFPSKPSSFLMGGTAQDSMLVEEGSVPSSPPLVPPPSTRASLEARQKEEGFFPLRLSPMQLLKQQDERSEASSIVERSPSHSSRGPTPATTSVASCFRDAARSPLHSNATREEARYRSGRDAGRKGAAEPSAASSLQSADGMEAAAMGTVPVRAISTRAEPSSIPSRRSSINDVAAYLGSSEPPLLYRRDSATASEGVWVGAGSTLLVRRTSSSLGSHTSNTGSPFGGDGGSRAKQAGPRYRLLHTRNPAHSAIVSTGTTSPKNNSLPRQPHYTTLAESCNASGVLPTPPPLAMVTRSKTSLLHPLSAVSPTKSSSSTTHRHAINADVYPGDDTRSPLPHQSHTSAPGSFNSMGKSSLADKIGAVRSPHSLMPLREREKGGNGADDVFTRGSSMESGSGGVPAHDNGDLSQSVDGRFQRFPHVFPVQTEKASQLVLADISSTLASNTFFPSEMQPQDESLNGGFPIPRTASSFQVGADGGGREGPFGAGNFLSDSTRGAGDGGGFASSGYNGSPRPPGPPLLSLTSSFDRPNQSRSSGIQRMRSRLFPPLSPGLSRSGGGHSGLTIRTHLGVEDAADELVHTMSRWPGSGGGSSSTTVERTEEEEEASMMGTHGGTSRAFESSEVRNSGQQGNARHGIPWSRMAEGAMACFSPSLGRRRTTFFAEDFALPAALGDAPVKIGSVYPISPQNPSTRGGDARRGGSHLSPFLGSHGNSARGSVSGVTTPISPQPLMHQARGGSREYSSFPFSEEK